MTHQLESIAGFVSTIVAAIFGAVTLPSMAELATNEQIPDWTKWLLGPLGALIGMIIAIKWLTARLNKAEEREESRREDREKSMEKLVELAVRSNLAIEQNSEVLKSVRKALEK